MGCCLSSGVPTVPSGPDGPEPVRVRCNVITLLGLLTSMYYYVAPGRLAALATDI